MNWELKRFSEIVTLSKGEAITKASEKEGPFPVVLGGQEPAYYIDRYNHKGEAIVISRSGASAGYASFWNEPIFITDGYLVEPTAGNYRKYVYYLLKYYGKALRDLQNGSAIPHVTPKTIYNLKATIPPLNVQKTIAGALSAYDNLIEVNNKRIKVLEKMAENLYKEWFVRFRFPGHETAEFENGIPKGWEQCSVESLSSILQRGISPDYDDDGNLTVISQKCIRQNIMDIREARQQVKAFKSELNLRDGDTVICSTGTGTLGRVGQIFGEYPNTTFDSHVTLIRAKNGIGKHFLYWTLKEMQPWFMNMGIGSTNQQELYRNTIKNAKAIRPTRQLMMQFEGVVEPIHQNIITLISSQDNLIKQRDLLLPRLMSGKLEV